MISNLTWAVRRLVLPDRALVALCALPMIISTVLPALQPVLSRRIVDTVVSDGSASGLAWWVGLMALTFLLPGLATNLASIPNVTLEERTVRRLDELVIKAGAAMADLGPLERPAMHDRIRFVRDNIVACMRIPQLGLRAITGAFGVLTLLITLGSLVWWMPVLLLAAAVPHMIGERRMLNIRFRTMRDQSRAAREMDYCLTAASDPQLAKEVRAFGLGDFFLRRFDSRSSTALAQLAAVRLRSSRLSAAGALGYAAAVAISFGYVVRQAGQGDLTAGDVALYLTAITSLFLGLFQLSMSSIGALEPLQRLDAIRELEQRARTEIKITENGRVMPVRLKSGITLSDVRFRYGATPASRR
ncbi:MAG TPA: hypothetical protein VIP98_12520, partial [Microlunatus sp.]